MLNMSALSREPYFSAEDMAVMLKLMELGKKADGWLEERRRQLGIKTVMTTMSRQQGREAPRREAERSARLAAAYDPYVLQLQDLIKLEPSVRKHQQALLLHENWQRANSEAAAARQKEE